MLQWNTTKKKKHPPPPKKPTQHPGRPVTLGPLARTCFSPPPTAPLKRSCAPTSSQRIDPTFLQVGGEP